MRWIARGRAELPTAVKCASCTGSPFWPHLISLPATSLSPHAFSANNYASAANVMPKRKRIFLLTPVTEPFSVPLTLADVQLRNEQLPFAYMFRSTLDAERLTTSFREVLRRYPIIGTKANFKAGKIPTLEGSVDDTVSMSFGYSESTLEECLQEKRSGKIQHQNWRGGGEAPLLSPLFDDLSSARWNESGKGTHGLASKDLNRDSRLMTVKITFFKGGGTAVGINISHLLGDANSCFRIAQVWGREMRGLVHPMEASNNRADATLTGMVSLEMAAILNIGAEKNLEKSSTVAPFLNAMKYVKGVLVSGLSTEEILIDANSPSDAFTKNGSHEYVRLSFTPGLLHAMKMYGLAHAMRIPSLQPSEGYETTGKARSLPSFVSTNDMVTAFGWMIKREVSKKYGWNLSMVVNLRNRGGINAFSCVEDDKGRDGCFGNALTSVVAKLPPSRLETCDISSGGQANMVGQVGDAALSIRQSLAEDMVDIGDRLSLSRIGLAPQAANQGDCFSTTSWRQFPIWDIDFGNDYKHNGGANAGGLCGFYGRPSHKLPKGDTYSSVIVPSGDGGCNYKLLAPTRFVQSILQMHRNLSSSFLTWESRQRGTIADAHL